MPLRRNARISWACLLFLVSGCAEFASSGTNPIRADVESWAAERGFQADSITAGQFEVFSLLRKTAASSDLAVYIEGDGAGWPSIFAPPRDPTPHLSTVLQLASSDASAAVAYLGRPCQYLSDNARGRCGSHYWNERRFSTEVLRSMSAAIDDLKRRSGARSTSLIGYSGGGVVAALLAMERNDVTNLITIAAPLALSDWAAIKKLTPFDDSSDPYQRRRSPIIGAATHFAGSKDDVVPSSIVKRFVDAQGGRLLIMEGYDHQCCWVEAWPTLLRRAGIKEVVQ